MRPSRNWDPAERLGESFLGLHVLEGMEQRGAFLNERLYCGRTRRRKITLPRWSSAAGAGREPTKGGTSKQAEKSTAEKSVFIWGSSGRPKRF